MPLAHKKRLTRHTYPAGLTNLIFFNNPYFVFPVHNFLLWTIKIWSKFNWMVEASWDMSAYQFLSTSQNDCWWSWSLWHQSRWGLLSNYNNTYLLSLIITHFLFPKWNINKIIFVSFQVRSEIAGFWLQSPIWLNTKNVSIALCPVTKTLTAIMLEYFVSDFGGMYVELIIYWNNTLNNNACY